MLPSSQDYPPQTVVANKKNKLVIFTGIFKKKPKEEEEETEPEEEFEIDDDEVVEELARLDRSTPVDIPERGGRQGMPFCMRDHAQSHSPMSPRVRNLDRDMEALRLSRQDNPYIQHQLERMSLPSSADFSSPPRQDEERLVEMVDDDDDDPIDCNLHEHLIRSPPPQFPQNVSQFLFPQRSKTGSMSAEEISSACSNSRDLNPLLNKSGVDVLDPGMRAVLEFQRQRLASEHRMSLSTPNEGGRRSVDAMLVSQWSPTLASRPISFHGASLPGLAFLSDPRQGLPISGVSPTDSNHSRLSRHQGLNDSRETLLHKTSLDSFG